MDILWKKGFEWKEGRLTRNMYLNQKVKMHVGDVRAEDSKIGEGVMQGYFLLPTLCNIYLEKIIKDCFNKERGISIRERRVECMWFADDVVVLAESEEEINGMLEDLRESCSKYGMKINVKKTKGIVTGGKVNNNTKVSDEIIEQKDQFRYLGSNIN